MSKLVIVESPKKAKTISKILGKDYLVKASIGHVRDLPTKKLGVNVRKNFEPQYEILRDKEPIIKELREAALLADKVYLAPDPDREGEAIAWHLSELLDLPPKKIHRIEFNEITKEAVLNAIKSPRKIDQRLVDAQQARRVLDRLVGYKISPLLWRKVNGRSAGRVQSVAVRLICEREEEIEAFTAREYWFIRAELSRARSKQSFNARLTKYGGKRVIGASEKSTAQTMIIDSEALASKIQKEVQKAEFKVTTIQERSSQRQPSPPFITSSLQRDAGNHLGFAVKKTMQVAQSLYEGVEIGSAAEPTGLITYMRTDSTRVAQQAQDEALAYIEDRFGKDYCPSKPRQYIRKAKGVQDAHEAIRPSYIDVDHSPEKLKSYLTPDQFKLYKLIWERFLASQMSSAELSTRTAEITAANAVFRASATDVKFAGFTIVYNRVSKGAEADTDSEEPEEQDDETANLPDLDKGEALKVKGLEPSQHFTQPPPRFTETSLVKRLEDLGIGRPSTYGATITTIQGAKYVEKQQKALVPTKLGRAVNLLLMEHFSSIIDVSFTATMEAKLDQIEEDKVDWHGMLQDFYQPFKETLSKAQESMNKIVILSDQKCPTCGDSMAIRSSRFGQFLGCIKYPECKEKIKLTKDGEPVPPDRPSEEICKTCASPMLIRYGRHGDYLACSSETCEEKRPILKTTGVMCPRAECGGEIVEKKARRGGKVFWGCSNYSLNQCNSAYWYPPIIGGPGVDNKCPNCGSLLVYKTLKKGDQVACPVKECKWSRPANDEPHAGVQAAPPVAAPV